MPKKRNCIFAGWWFQPIRNILVKLDHLPQIGLKFEQTLQPQPNLTMERYQHNTNHSIRYVFWLSMGWKLHNDQESGHTPWSGIHGPKSPNIFFFPAIGLLGETRRHSGSFLIKRWYSVLCHFLQGTSHFSVLDIKWVSVTQVPSYLHSFMCPGEPWSSYSSFVHCSWYQSPNMPLQIHKGPPPKKKPQCFGQGVLVEGLEVSLVSMFILFLLYAHIIHVLSRLLNGVKSINHQCPKSILRPLKSLRSTTNTNY